MAKSYYHQNKFDRFFGPSDTPRLKAQTIPYSKTRNNNPFSYIPAVSLQLEQMTRGTGIERFRTYKKVQWTNVSQQRPVFSSQY